MKGPIYKPETNTAVFEASCSFADVNVGLYNNIPSGMSQAAIDAGIEVLFAYDPEYDDREQCVVEIFKAMRPLVP